MYYQLDEGTACNYVRESPLMSRVFGNNADLRVADLSDGNINLIFRVYDAGGPIARSVLLKQALPHARRYPEVKLPLERAQIEFEALKLEGKCCPELVPRVYLYDPEMYLNVMEDMNQHIVMRSGLMDGVKFPSVGVHLGRFLANTLFYTSDFYLPSAEKKTLVQQFMNPRLCRITEDLVFTEPYVEHSNNRWNRVLDEQIAGIRKNEAIRNEVLLLKRKFMCDAQALIHGDLHTGSVLVNQDETKIIDPEFAYVGPMGFDIGSLVAHLVLSYASHGSEARESQQHGSYRDWLLGVVRQMWEVMESELCRLWEVEGSDLWSSAAFREGYVCALVVDTAGFAACEVVRRIVGLAHVADLDGIEDSEERAAAESLCLNVARMWLLERKVFTSIDDLISVVEEAAG